MLNGNTQLSNDDSDNGLTVDLTGITANGNCVEYSGANGAATTEAANLFANGPTACATTSTSSGSTSTAAAPKTPDTGLGAIQANPLLSAGLTLATVGSLVVIGRRLQQNNASGSK